MKRESFIVYKSFYSLIKMLKPKSRLKIFEAIFDYGFNNTIPNFEDDEQVTAVWEGIFPQLRANQKRYENGLKGGAPQNNQNAKKFQSENNQRGAPQNNHKTTKKQPNENVNENVNKNDLKEEENREEEKSSSSPLEFLNEEISSFVREYNIVVDGYNGNIQALDFGKIRKAFKESAWLRQNISSLKKVCEIYPKIESGYYKDYVVVGEIVIPQEEWFKVEKVLLEMKQNSTDFNPNYESYKDYKAKQENLYATLSEDVRAYYGDYGGFVSLFEYKSLENEKARFIRDFEKFCQKRRMKNA